MKWLLRTEINADQAFFILNQLGLSYQVKSAPMVLDGHSFRSSEVIVVGPADGVYISSRDSTIGDGDPAIGRSFFLPANEIMTFRGITNVTELSALRGASTSRNLHYRTQYFGSIIPIAS